MRLMTPRLRHSGPNSLFRNLSGNDERDRFPFQRTREMVTDNPNHPVWESMKRLREYLANSWH